MYSKKFFIISIVPAFIVFLLLMVYPLSRVIYLSLTNTKLNSVRPETFVGISQYVKLFADNRFISAMTRTLYFTAMSVGFSVLLGFCVAYIMHIRHLWGMNFFRTVILIPMFITPLVAGSVFRFMFDYDYGIINYVLSQLNIEKVQFLSSTQWALNSAIIVDVWQWFPFAAVIFSAGLENIPVEPLEAASIDGAGGWTKLWKIKFPFLKSIIGIVILIRFMDAFREFDKIYILTSGGPGTSSETVSVYVWRQAFQYYNTGYASAAGVIMLMIITIISTLYANQVNKRKKGSEII